MKVYIVQNSDDVVLAVFKKKAKAQSFIKNIGVKVWKEDWKINTMKTNKTKRWLKKDN